MKSFFTETTSSGNYFKALTGMRGLAALLVLLFHVAGAFNKVTDLDNFWIVYVIKPFYGYGFLGVQLFFVLSGFLLSFYFLSAQKKHQPPNLRKFALNRCLRVLPSYYFQLACLIVVWLVLDKPVIFYDVLLHVLMMHNFMFETNDTFNNVYWTLPIEWDFYFFLPLFALLFIGDRIKWLIALALIFGPIARVFVGEVLLDGLTPIHRVWLLSQFPVIPEYFLLGMVGAYFRFTLPASHTSLRYGDSLMLLGGIVFVLSIGVIHWASYWEDSQHYWWNTLSSLSLACFVFGVSANGRLASLLFANKVMCALGILSYGIYLWHTVVIDSLHDIYGKDIGDWMIQLGVTPVQALFLTTIVVVCLSCIIAYLNHRLIEKPFLALKFTDKSSVQTR